MKQGDKITVIMRYDTSSIRINGLKHILKYEGRNAGYGASAGFAFGIYDATSEEKVGYLLVLIYDTASTLWKNYTKYPYDPDTAEHTVRLALDAVIPTMNLKVPDDYTDQWRYRGEAILVQITTNPDGEEPDKLLYSLHSYDSPEDFVAKHLYGEKNNPRRVRSTILARLYRWEEEYYGQTYSTKDLSADLFLPRQIVLRNVDYLAGRGVEQIEKTIAGDDEFNIKLTPSGMDYAETVNEISSTAETTFMQTSVDQAIYDGLLKHDLALVRSYEQVVADLNDQNHKSWKGTANEIREIVSTLIRELAPDSKVTGQQGYVRQKGTSGPTQKQRVKYILEQRRVGSKEAAVLQDIDTIEDRIAAFVRKFYERASNSTHTSAERKEILTIYGYFTAFMRDLLDLE